MCRIVDPIKTGARLKQLCKEKGLTAKDIQRLLNLSERRSVYYWFSGESLPTIDNLYMLAGYLGVSLDEIIVARENDPSKPSLK